MKLKNHNIKSLYNLPKEIKFCTKCVISNQRPRITFDENGVCSACNFAEFKKNKIDWDERLIELKKLCDVHRKNDGSYDVIVPCSGGKDGSYVAHQLKYEFGMNPLTVTWSPLLPTDIGKKNLFNFIQSGFDNVFGTPNGLVAKKLTNLSFKHLGDPFQPFIYGQTNFPLKIAVQNKVSLIMYGENGEVEYGGDMKNAFSPTRQISDHDKHYFSGLPPEFWKKHGVLENDLKTFMAPKYSEIEKNKTEIHFFSYYKFWDPQENFYYATEHCGFTTNPERSEGTYSKYASLDDKLDGFHYYLAYIKFGIGRTTSDAAHEIRDEKINREEGITLVEKFDGEFPQKYLNDFLNYIDISEDEFHNLIDTWRSDHIWDFKNHWVLKNTVF